MNWKRTGTFGIAGAAAAALLAGASTPARRPIAAPAIPAPSRIDLQGAELAAEIDRLRSRLRPTTEPVQPQRNLFRFNAREAAIRGRVEPAPPPPEPQPPPVAAEARPSFSLIGIAEDAGPDGPVRTAILSGAGDVLLLKVGDVTGSRYRVAAISPSSVDLVHAESGETLTLTLK